VPKTVWYHGNDMQGVRLRMFTVPLRDPYPDVVVARGRTGQRRLRRTQGQMIPFLERQRRTRIARPFPVSRSKKKEKDIVVAAVFVSALGVEELVNQGLR